MITLEEYKNMLINFYKYPIDNSKEKREKRLKQLEAIYKDYFLEKIINNTYEFLANLYDGKEFRYRKYEVGQDNTDYIFLGLSGGWFSDRLYKDLDGNIISEVIVHKELGDSLSMYIDEEVYENEDEEDEDLVYFEFHHYLYLQDFPDNMNELEEKYVKQRTLKP